MTNRLQHAYRYFAGRHAYLCRLLESVEEGLLVVHRDHRVVYANGRLREILAVPKSVLFSGTTLEAVPLTQHILTRMIELADSVFSTGSRRAEAVHIPGNGEQDQHLEISACKLRGPRRAKREVVITVRDISDRIRLQEQLCRAEKLATIGQLAAGVAHEINNPMACILACAQGLKSEHVPGEGQRAEYLDIITASARRCKGITQKLLDYSAHSHTESGPVDLKEVLDEACAVTQFEAERKHVHVMFNMSGDAPPVSGSADLLIQVFVDLLLNGIQATKAGGEVRIDVTSDDRHVQVHVADNGAGISPEIRSRIFDPFFTTKAVGEGTGLGLSVSQGIVQELGGSLDLIKWRAGWTCFRVSLPAVPRSLQCEAGRA